MTWRPQTDGGTAATESDNPGEPVRRGTGAEGFPHGSKYPLFVGAGMFLVSVGLVWLPVLIVGIPVLVYGLWGWTVEYTIEEYEMQVVPEQKRQLLGMESGLVGMYIVIVSEILIFAGFFVAWFYLDATRGPFPPPGFPELSLSLGALMTVILLVGSLTARYGRVKIGADDRQGLVYGYLGTIVTGLLFLGVLGLEWSRLIADGLTWQAGPYGASYYGLAGLHGLHLAAGIVLFAIVVYRAAARDHFSSTRNLMVRTTEAYWHFLTSISIAIFLFVYFGT